jgi:hypothetical protein
MVPAATPRELEFDRSPSFALRMSWRGTIGDAGLPGPAAGADGLSGPGELTRTVIVRGVAKVGVAGAPDTLRARRRDWSSRSGVAGRGRSTPTCGTAGLSTMGKRVWARGCETTREPGARDGVAGPPPPPPDNQRSPLPGSAGLRTVEGDDDGMMSLKWSRRNLDRAKGDR